MKLNKMTFGYIFLFLFIYLFILILYLFFTKIINVPSSENNYLDENKLNHKIEKIKIPSDNGLIFLVFQKK